MDVQVRSRGTPRIGSSGLLSLVLCGLVGCGDSADQPLPCDEALQRPVFYDADADGYGGDAIVLACNVPAGFAPQGGDCQDFNSGVHPGAMEECDDVDNDCDGEVDEDLPTQPIYPDKDGDGFAPAMVIASQKCNIPHGWTPVQGDCGDSDASIFPGAPTLCDGKDNDCDGVVDRLCFVPCEGDWPYKPPVAQGQPTSVAHVDMDGDGRYEVIFQSTSAFAILDHHGVVLHQSQGSQNYSRSDAVVADIDNYDEFGPLPQSIEVLTGNNSVTTYYKLQDGVVKVIPGANAVYDASRFMVADIDLDGVVELFTSSWCEPTQGARVFRYNRAADAIEHAVDIPDPNGGCEYNAGRSLTDLNGDGRLELVLGNGYAGSNVSLWSGRIHALRFTDPLTLAYQPLCDSANCFPTESDMIFRAGVTDLFRIGNEIRAAVSYFEQPVAGSAHIERYWSYSLDGEPMAGSPSTIDTTWLATTDLDKDGLPEDSSEVADIGLFDVNDDGYPDRIIGAGPELHIDLWDASLKTFVTTPSSSLQVSGTDINVRSVWDLDGDGNIEVLSTDNKMNTFCHQLGKGTWKKSASLPPHFPRYLRTYQWDNYEPNDGSDTNADGIPDRIIRVPSAITTSGDFYSYISSLTDKDFYLIHTSWSGEICLSSPEGSPYSMKVYAFEDKKAPAGPDGLVWEDTTGATTKCFNGNLVTPTRVGEYRFVVGIEPQANASPFWPYWLSAPM